MSFTLFLFKADHSKQMASGVKPRSALLRDSTIVVEQPMEGPSHRINLYKHESPANSLHAIGLCKLSRMLRMVTLLTRQYQALQL